MPNSFNLHTLVTVHAGGYIVEMFPPWFGNLQLDPDVNTGIDGCSTGLTIQNPTTVHRHRLGKFETDGAKWGAGGYSYDTECFM